MSNLLLHCISLNEQAHMLTTCLWRRDTTMADCLSRPLRRVHAKPPNVPAEDEEKKRVFFHEKNKHVHRDPPANNKTSQITVSDSNHHLIPSVVGKKIHGGAFAFKRDVRSFRQCFSEVELHRILQKTVVSSTNNLGNRCFPTGSNLTRL